MSRFLGRRAKGKAAGPAGPAPSADWPRPGRLWTLVCVQDSGTQSTYSVQDAQGKTDSQGRALSLHRCHRTSGVGSVQETEPWIDQRLRVGTY